MTDEQIKAIQDDLYSRNWEVSRLHIGRVVEAARRLFPEQHPSQSDYEAVLADHKRLVRELDVLLNGEDGAAQQAFLVDLVAQVRRQGIRAALPNQSAGEPVGKIISRVLEIGEEVVPVPVWFKGVPPVGTLIYTSPPPTTAQQEAGEPVAVLRWERGTPGRENEMPRVVSCNSMPDGEYPVYTSPPPTDAAKRVLDKSEVKRIATLMGWAPPAISATAREKFEETMRNLFGSEFPDNPNAVGAYPGWEVHWAIFQAGAAPTDAVSATKRK